MPGLGLKGTGIRKPVALENEQVVYTRVPGAGSMSSCDKAPRKCSGADFCEGLRSEERGGGGAAHSPVSAE